MRNDLTAAERDAIAGLPFATVDAATTRDHDDAFHIEPAPEGGGVVLHVAIANAAALVPAGSDLDREAQRLAATNYDNPAQIVPMLPAALSEEAGSLKPGAAKAALVHRIELDAGLEVARYALAAVEIGIAERLTYDDIAQVAERRECPVGASVALGVRVAQGLLAARQASGALALLDVQRLVGTGEEGRLVQFRSRSDALGHLLVQETMILANRLAARYMAAEQVPAIFRVHEPNLSAPPASEIVRSVQAWLAAGSLDAASAQIALAAGAARYEPVARGHFGLRLPAYLHGTSPLRRYADLVNQRQLLAHLDGAALPYDQRALAVIAEHLNATIAARKEARSQGFKDRVTRAAGRGLERGQLARLADHEIVKAVAIAVGGVQEEALAAELARRVAAGSLADKVLYAAFEAALTETGAVQAARGAVGLALAARPAAAAGMLAYAASMGLAAVGSPIRSQVAVGGSFRVRLSGKRLRDRRAFETEGSGRAARAAEIEAAVRLACALAGVEVPAAADKARDAAAATPTGPNPKSVLSELCQARGWPLPAYESSAEGPPHAPRFHARVTLQTPSGALWARSKAAAGTRQAAEVDAAAAALERLDVGEAERRARPAAPAAGDNPIGLLQEAAVRSGAAMPRYEFSDAADAAGEFTCTLHADGAAYTGRARSKQEAKRRAAFEALRAMVDGASREGARPGQDGVGA